MKPIHKIGLMAAMMVASNPIQSNFKVDREQSEESQPWRRKKCKSCLSMPIYGNICNGRFVKPTSKACNQWKGK